MKHKLVNVNSYQASMQTSKKLSKKASKLNHLLRSSFAAKLQAIVNLPKIKLPNAHFLNILNLQILLLLNTY